MGISGSIRGATSSIAALGMLAACAGQPVPQALRTNQNVLPLAEPRPSASYVYVAQCCGVVKDANGGINVYQPLLAGVTERIQRGAKYPYSVELDGHGNLYIFNCICDNTNPTLDFGALTEYAEGAKRPSRRIGPFYWATAFTLDPTNRLYIANCNTCYKSLEDRRENGVRDTVNVYKDESSKLLYAITQGIHVPVALTFDPAGNLYVANLPSRGQRAAVTVYAPGKDSPVRTITNGIRYPGILTTDRNGHLFVGDSGDKSGRHSKILEYAAGSDKILHGIPSQGQGFFALAIDASGALYVGYLGVSSSAGWVSVYAPGNFTEKYRITKGIYWPEALALDGTRNLYVANVDPNSAATGWLSVYAPGSKTPARVVKSGAFGPPNSIAIGPAP